MPRVLDVRRAHVASAQQSAYRAAIVALAARLENRDVHVWLFRSRKEPAEFIEFIEGLGPGSPRAHASDATEQSLLDQLQHFARYDDEDTVWDAVTLMSGAGDGATDR